MPFGLKNAPATFQRLINNVLHGTDSWFYLDDIIVPGKDLMDHNLNLLKVFERLRQHNLKLQPDKCEFLKTEVTYLGHVIYSKGISPNNDKIKAITEIKQPKNAKGYNIFLIRIRISRILLKMYPIIFRNCKTIKNTFTKREKIQMVIKM